MNNVASQQVKHVEVGVNLTGGKVVIGGKFLPGQTQQMIASTIKNTGNTTENFAIHTKGDLVVSPLTFTLKPHQKTFVNVKIQVPFSSNLVGSQTGWIDVVASSKSTHSVTAGANAEYIYTLAPASWLTRSNMWVRVNYEPLVGVLILLTIAIYATKGVMKRLKNKKKKQNTVVTTPTLQQ